MKLPKETNKGSIKMQFVSSINLNLFSLKYLDAKIFSADLFANTSLCGCKKGGL